MTESPLLSQANLQNTSAQSARDTAERIHVKLPVTVVVIARNEEKNIGRCLASLMWAQEVIVVDNESTDRTREKALEYSNAVVLESPWLGYAETKRVGLNAARNGWIFWVDADEVIPPKLQLEIAALFQGAQLREETVYAVDRKTYFLGRWIRGCGWFPSRVVRLFHKNHATFNTNILHEGVDYKPNTSLVVFHEPLLHDSYVSVQSYFGKMVKYGELGALELERKRHPARFTDVLLRPLAAFLRSYFFRHGYQDGAAGVVISLGTAMSVFIKYVTYYFYVRLGGFEKRRADEPWEKN